MSANNFAQLAASYFWGWASDATGRKPLLLLSNVVSGAASAWFVSTRTFGQGLAARALSGCFMCSGVVMKSMIGLHYTKQGQVREEDRKHRERERERKSRCGRIWFLKGGGEKKFFPSHQATFFFPLQKKHT